MSLNWLSDSSVEKKWMNINCNDLKCESLEASIITNGSGSYVPTISSLTNCTVSFNPSVLYSRNNKNITINFRADLNLTGGSEAKFSINLPSTVASNFTTNLSGVQISPSAHVLVQILSNASGTNSNLSLSYSDGSAFAAGIVSINGYISYVQV